MIFSFVLLDRLLKRLTLGAGRIFLGGGRRQRRRMAPARETPRMLGQGGKETGGGQGKGVSLSLATGEIRTTSPIKGAGFRGCRGKAILATGGRKDGV